MMPLCTTCKVPVEMVQATYEYLCPKCSTYFPVEFLEAENRAERLVWIFPVGRNVRAYCSLVERGNLLADGTLREGFEPGTKWEPVKL